MEITKKKQMAETTVILDGIEYNLLEVDKDMAKYTKKEMRKCFGLIQYIKDMRMKKHFKDIYGFYTQMSFCILVKHFKGTLSKEWANIINNKINEIINKEATYQDMINITEYITNLSTFKKENSQLEEDKVLFYYWMNRYAEQQ